MPDQSLVIGGLVTTAVTASVGVIGALNKWLAYRRALTDHTHEISQDVAVVKFWEEWLRVRLLTSDDEAAVAIKAHVQRELELLPTFPTRAVLLERARMPSALARMLLLYLPPRAGWWPQTVGWLLRAVFYWLAIWCLFTFSALLAEFIINPAAPLSVIFQVIPGGNLSGTLMWGLLLTAFLALIARNAALRFDAPTLPKNAAAEAPSNTGRSG